MDFRHEDGVADLRMSGDGRVDTQDGVSSKHDRLSRARHIGHRQSRLQDDSPGQLASCLHQAQDWNQ